ncbi:MAG TPA: hypothetical protein EYG38_11885, partial [Verrucomicrobia bacterium]|nr:hypothetical protein [Verrucomicrobiota bacterium]
MRLRTKIMALPMIVSCFLLVIGMMVSKRLQVIKASVTEITDSLAVEANEISSIHQSIIESDVIIQKYLSEEDVSLLQEFGEITTSFEKTLKRIQRRMVNPERVTHLDLVEKLYLYYSSTFTDVVVSQTQTTRELERSMLDHNGPRVRKALTDIISTAFEDEDMVSTHAASEMLGHFLIARIYSHKYRAHLRPADAERVRLELLASEVYHLEMTESLSDP